MHTLIPLDDADGWRAALSGVPYDFFHTWEYNNAIKLTHELPTQLYVYKSNKLTAVCPLSERSLRGYVDITTPPGFSGFVGVGDWDGFLACWSEFARDNGWVCGYIGLNPILSPIGALTDEAAPQHTNDAYVLDLTLDTQTLFEAMSHGRRSDVRKHVSAPVKDRKLLTDFVVAQYPAFLRQVSASSSYDRTPETLAALCSADNVLLIGGEGHNGLDAAYLFTYTPFVATYLISVALPSARNRISSMVWFALEHFKELGVPCLNLGAGIQRNDSLARSKKLFGAEARPMYALTQIYRESEYRQLCLVQGRDPKNTSNFFPAYRVPPAS